MNGNNILFMRNYILTGLAVAGVVIIGSVAWAFTPSHAAFTYSHTITLEPGWSAVSPARVVDSHTFSAAENSTNFDIYLLDPSKPSGWATMAQMGQTQFTPLYGYFINNKTGVAQTLMLNYKDGLSPAERLFSRTFGDTEGWYSVGVANPTYAWRQCEGVDTGSYDYRNLTVGYHGFSWLVDFTAGNYESDPSSVYAGNDWDMISQHDLWGVNPPRDTKAYAVYMTEERTYLGFQNSGDPNVCIATTPTPTPTPTPDPTPGFDPDGGTAGTITDITAGYPIDSIVQEGATQVSVADYELSLANSGPLLLQNVDVHMYANWSPDARPWTYVEQVCLSLNWGIRSCLDASTSAAWSYLGGDEYSIQFTNVDGVLASSDTSDLRVHITAREIIDSADIPAGFDVWVGQMRLLDESGGVQYQNAYDWSGDYWTFTFDAAAVATLEFRDATDEIDAMVIEVDDVSDTTGVAIYRFSIEETNNVGVDISDLSLALHTNVADVIDVVKVICILEASTEIGCEVAEGGSTDEVVVFEDVNISLGGGQRMEFTVKVDLEDTDDHMRYPNGEQLFVEVVGDEIRLEDANGNDQSDVLLDISAVSNTHELRSEGISVQLTSITESASGDNDEYGAFTFKFDVTAFGDDAFVYNGCDELGVGDGVQFSVNGGTYSDCSLASTADEYVASFLVSEGDTEVFTLTVAIDGTGGFASVTMEEIDWALYDGGIEDGPYILGGDEWESDSLFLQSI